jgi:23S rRNA (cytosine1962-C5)-methyltransferase
VPPSLEIAEYGLRFFVDLLGGQKTGFFLDQRENRRRVASYCADARVLNCFAYTGAVAVYAAAAGAAQVINVDTSADALRLAEQHLALNDFASARDEYRVGDVFQVLREYREREERFDVIILDPPKFAHSADQVTRATRGYKDINLLALQLLNPNGILATFSCSGLISPDLFQKVVFGASVDAARPAQIIERLTQAPDHPVLLSFPESEYLKGLICRAV